MCYVPYQPNVAANDAASLQACDSLSEAQSHELEAGMASVPGTWEIDRQESYDGHLTLIITAADASPELLFAVWRDGTDLQLSTMQGDEQVAVQACNSVEAVLLTIRGVVAPRSLSSPLSAAARLRLV